MRYSGRFSDREFRSSGWLHCSMGVFSMLRGGQYGGADSNTWMRRRVLTQAVAIVLITIGFAYKAMHH